MSEPAKAPVGSTPTSSCAETAKRDVAGSGRDRETVVREPGVLFADEPTGALDSATGESIVQLLAGIAARGTAVVVVTHDEGVASHFARRIRLRDGVATEAVTW